jgi:hypothetical protein
MPCLAYDEGVTDCCERMSLRSDANGALFLSRMASRKLRLRVMQRSDPGRHPDARPATGLS